MSRSKLLRQLKVVDLVFEIVDARCPASSRSPLPGRWPAGKQQVLVLNKADLADPQVTEVWIRHFRAGGRVAFAVSCRDGGGFRELRDYLKECERALAERLEQRGRRPRELRAVVVGIPNTGKSSFLNRLIGRRAAATGNRPGVTRGEQWIHVQGNLSVLDTPGVLPPRWPNRDKSNLLIFIGAVEAGDQELEAAARDIISFLEKNYPGCLNRFLGLSSPTLEDLALHKHFLLPGGLPDGHRAAVYLLNSLQNGRLDRISLERPGEPGE